MHVSLPAAGAFLAAMLSSPVLASAFPKMVNGLSDRSANTPQQHNKLRFRPRRAAPPQQLAPRQADPTAPWVSVDASGTPRTVTPVLTTVSGTPTLLNGAPADLTATVFTRTDFGDVRTTTAGQAAGDNGGIAPTASGVAAPPIPTASSVTGAGAFPVCANLDGDLAPFCMPSRGQKLAIGATYYVTWDPAFFPSNTTVMVTGNYFNASTGAITTQAFASPRLSAAWSFYAWPVDEALIKGAAVVGATSANISLSIAALAGGSAAVVQQRGPTVEVTYPPTYQQQPAKVPTGQALYIGIPSVVGFVILVLAGTCIWNRKARKISLGNIMSRSRHGYGAGKSRTQRMGMGGGRRGKKAAATGRAVPLANVPPEQQYRDVPEPKTSAPNVQPVRSMLTVDTARDHSKRDSDALGSLAGSPTEDRQMDYFGAQGHHAQQQYRPQQHGGYGQQQGAYNSSSRDDERDYYQGAGRQHAGGANVFRDEMSRQDRDRSGF